MTGWQQALEAGINKAWGGRNATGYSGTVNLVTLVAHVLAEAGYEVVPFRPIYPEHNDGSITDSVTEADTP